MQEQRGSTKPDGLLSVAETCGLLGVSRPTVQRLIARGALPIVKLGTRTLIRPTDLAALIHRGGTVSR